MDQNPYAPPRREPQFLPATDNIAGEPQPWDIGGVISESWQTFKQYWPTLLGAGIVLYVIVFAINIGSSAIFGGGFGRQQDFSAAAVVGALVSFVAQQIAQAFLMVGMNRIYLAAARGQTPDFGTLFSGGDRFVVSLLATLLMTLAIFGGFLLLIIPGIILSLGLYNTMFFAADTDLGVVDCLKASWNSLNGHKSQLFGLGVVLLLLNIGGMLACGLGLLVTIPMSFLAMSIVYTRTSGRTGSAPLAAAGAY